MQERPTRAAMVAGLRSPASVAVQGVQGISDIITIPGLVNVDFADVKAIMCNSGTAMLGVGVSSGKSRAEEAAMVRACLGAAAAARARESEHVLYWVLGLAVPNRPHSMESATDMAGAGFGGSHAGPQCLSLARAGLKSTVLVQACRHSDWHPTTSLACRPQPRRPSSSAPSSARLALCTTSPAVQTSRSKRSGLWPQALVRCSGRCHACICNTYMQRLQASLAYQASSTAPADVMHRGCGGPGSDSTPGLQVNRVSEVVTGLADPSANIIFGAVIDSAYEGEVHVTIIATGFTQSFEENLLSGKAVVRTCLPAWPDNSSGLISSFLHCRPWPSHSLQGAKVVQQPMGWAGCFVSRCAESCAGPCTTSSAGLLLWQGSSIMRHAGALQPSCRCMTASYSLHNCVSLTAWPAAGHPSPRGNPPQRGRALPALEPQPQPRRWGILLALALVDAADPAGHAPAAGLGCVLQL